MASGTKKQIRIEITEKEINRRIDEIEAANISEDLREFLIDVLQALIRLDQLVGMKNTTISRLKKIFNKQSEKSQTVRPKDKDESASGKNSGRNGKDQYPLAETIFHEHESLSRGDQCPACSRGTLYPFEPGVYIKITGSTPLTAIVHRTEKLRCSACGEIFEADFSGRDSPKYDAKAKSVVGLLKYGASTPFYRLEKIQKDLLTPLPSSTQWDLMEELANDLILVWKTMLRIGANSELAHVDDTSAKILNLMKDNRLLQNKGSQKKRQGMFTTGVLAKADAGHIMVFYFTGKNVSGENLDNLLDKRTQGEPMVVMSDALRTNHPRRHEVYQVLCNVHSRRNFLDLEEKYKKESSYVLDLISQIYQNEKVAIDLSPEERMLYHQKHSEPIMNRLETWCRRQFDKKLIEPNSTLGKGIVYILKHWVELTQFYRATDIPLDNNILEQHLRLPVLNRKNFLFYKSTLGALVGDIIMSIIKTCGANGVNAFEYMTSIQENRDRVKANSTAWLPWNFQTQLTQ